MWDEGDECLMSALELRLRCACAHCIEEMTGRKLLDPAKVPPDIRIKSMAVQGNYGVQIAFTDGHDTGIYRFIELRERCLEGRAKSSSVP